MSTRVGQWIEVDPSKVVESVQSKAAGFADGVQVSPSPYDIPLALRVVEGDSADQGYEVELRYLGGSESSSGKSETEETALVVGERSGRVYRIQVKSDTARAGARDRLDKVVEAIKRFRTEKSAMGARVTNYDLVAYAVQSNERAIVEQLHAARGPRKRMFDETWPGWHPD